MKRTCKVCHAKVTHECAHCAAPLCIRHVFQVHVDNAGYLLEAEQSCEAHQGLVIERLRLLLAAARASPQYKFGRDHARYFVSGELERLSQSLEHTGQELEKAKPGTVDWQSWKNERKQLRNMLRGYFVGVREELAAIEGRLRRAGGTDAGDAAAVGDPGE